MKKTLAALVPITALAALNGCTTTSGADAPVMSSTPAQSAAPGVSSPSTTAPSTALPRSADTSGQGTAVTITAQGQTLQATINDSQVSQDFLATLPTTLTWNRNAGIEFITELGAPLTETGPYYTDVQAGDIVYYNPLDSITVIYAPTSSVPTLTKMGEITSDLGALRALPGRVDMRIEVTS